VTVEPGRTTTAVRTHLEMRDISALRATDHPSDAVTLHRQHLTPAEYRALYSAVGEAWQWFDRLEARDKELGEYLGRSTVQVWILRVADEVAGYFELQRYEDGRVEIMYFGLLAPYFGRRLGGWMLTRAVEQAFAMDATHVTLHTCTLDSPHALPNYLARGFVIARQEEYAVDPR
jgi:ribosomal protein S18 acetylase RimI-like enzyme